MLFFTLVIGIYRLKNQPPPAKKTIKRRVSDERSLDVLDEHALSLDKPDQMNNATLIEWIERQLETPLETQIRRHQSDLFRANATPGLVLRGVGLTTEEAGENFKRAFGNDRHVRYLGWSSDINSVPTDFNHIKL